MVLATHAKLFGLPVIIPDSSGEQCANCNGAGTLPGSTLVRPRICEACHGYGRLMTKREELDYRQSWMEYYDGESKEEAIEV